MSEQIPDPSEGRAQREMYSGPVHGGPLDRTTLTVRFPKGVVAVDNEHNRAFIYDFVDDHFEVRDPAGYELERSKLEGTAEGAEYDIVVVS